MRIRTRNQVIHQVLRWRDLTADHKLLRVYEHGANVGALSFTLHLSDVVQGRAIVHVDPAAYIKTRLNRVLRDAGLAKTPFAFVLEFSKAGKLHSHGIIVAGTVNLDDVKRALRKAGVKTTKRLRAR